jgi:hypothetical protein
MSKVFRSREFRIARGLRCRFSYRDEPLKLEVEWDPGVPLGLAGRPAALALRNYRQARSDFLRAIAPIIPGGGAMLVIETDRLSLAQISLMLGAPGGHA